MLDRSDKSSHPGNVRDGGEANPNRSRSIAAASDSFWRHYWQWLAIGILAAATLVLGYIGFWKNSASMPKPRTALDIFYLTLQLFVLESGSVAGRVSWELQIARLIAPVVPAWTVIMAVAVLFRDRIQHIRMRWVQNHIVVCGLSRLGHDLARDGRSSGRRVAVIEIDEGNDYIQSAVNAGCCVVLGDATDPAVLADARAHRAKCVLAVTGEDGTNVAAAVALHDLLLHKPEGEKSEVISYAHVMDPGLCSLLQEQRLTVDADQQTALHFFNFYQDSARLLLAEHPLDREYIGPDDPRAVQLVIVGLGRMGQSLALEAARIGHYANRKPLRVTVVDLEAGARLRSFYGRHPRFNRVCDVEFIEGNIEDRNILEQIRGLAMDEKFLTTLAVCLDGDSRAFSSALAISSELGSTRTPICVRLSDETGLAALTERRGDNGIWETDVCSFGRMSRVCTLNTLLRQEQDLLARTIHEEYAGARIKEEHPAKDPSISPWKILDESLKISNRQQADHIEIKLRAIRCRSVPIGNGPFEPVVLEENEIKLMARMEHDRWSAERLLAGWTLGPKDVGKKVSPYLVPWEELPGKVRDFDFETVLKIPRYLSLIGRRIERPNLAAG